jgi:hypothetical protein
MSPANSPTSGSLPVDADTQRRIESYARAAGMSTAEVVREAFDKYETAHNRSHPEVEESAFGVLNRSGLIGRLKGAPDSPIDLSANREHTEDFGRA